MKFSTTLFTFAFTLLFSNTSFSSCVYDQSVIGENLQIGTMLTWTTSFEEDNAMFIIEKSDDGLEFLNVGSVDGSGDSEEIKDYNFLDVMANTEKAYYRLKQVDFDGSFSYSDVVTVKQQFQNNFMVARMSNIATQNDFSLTVDAFKDGELDYDVANWKQEQILKDKMIIVSGLNELNIDLADQKAGIYKVNLEMEGEKETLVIKKVEDEIKAKPNVASKNDGLDKSKN